VLGPSIVEVAYTAGIRGVVAPTLTYTGITLASIWIWSWIHWWGSADRRDAIVGLLTEVATHAA
jgi:hypothetical protein